MSDSRYVTSLVATGVCLAAACHGTIRGGSGGDGRGEPLVAEASALLPTLSVEVVDPAEPPAPGVPFTYERTSDPPGWKVLDPAGAWLATLTDHAWTVTLTGPERTFADESSSHPVVTRAWVRVLPAPFDGAVDPEDEAWLRARLVDTSPDILALAMQYAAGAPPVVVDGLKIAGDARYGAKRGADFNDYLGIEWVYPNGEVDPPEAHELGSLDCSGFLRMIFGYRSGMPMVWDPDGGASIPRRTWMIFAHGPGVVILPNEGVRPTALEKLAAGDLLFWDAKTSDGPQLDHSGMYLGVDQGGNHRFISSRWSLEGPTLGDSPEEPSILDGDGVYSRRFRGARRL